MTETVEMLARDRDAFEVYLDDALPPPGAAPERLHEAMRYAVLGGGKRLRPLLVLEGCRACGGDLTRAYPAAAAVEFIHTYSLIHDDLPAMDNDTLRRGQPTTHVAFGEALAILAGDALLTRAFELISPDESGNVRTPASVCGTLARAAGSDGMVGGQVLDLAAEGRQLDRPALEQVHRLKTGHLIRGSVVSGGLCAGGTAGEIAALAGYGDALGLAFQIVDDVLDVTGTSDGLGKSAGKDQEAGKSTFPALLGLAGSRAEATRQVNAAIGALDSFGPPADPLRQLARFVAERNH